MHRLAISLLLLALMGSCGKDQSDDTSEPEKHSAEAEKNESQPTQTGEPEKVSRMPLDPVVQFILDGTKEDLAIMKRQLCAKTPPSSMDVDHTALVHKIGKLKEADVPQLQEFITDAEKTALLDYPLAVARSRSMEIEGIRSKNPTEKYMPGCNDFELALLALESAGHRDREDVKGWFALYSEVCE